MFRPFSRAVKVVPKSKPGIRLSSTTTSRQVRSTHLSFADRPSYETIDQRILSQVGFTKKRQQVTAEYVDIHDLGGMVLDDISIDPADHDIQILDIDDAKLRHEVAEAVGIVNHAEATKVEADKELKVGDCIIYGRTLRTIFPAVVSYENRAHWVFFIVDTGSPLTYLSTQVGAPPVKERKAC